MHIRAFVGAAMLCLATLAFAPVAMADPAPNICVLDLSQPATIDHIVGTTEMVCDVLAVDVAAAVPIAGGDEDEAAGPCTPLAHATLTSTGHRQHEDPGRCSA